LQTNRTTKEQAMTISRRKVLKSMASAGALALPGGVFAPAIAQASLCGSASWRRVRASPQVPASAGLRGCEWAVEKFNAQGGIAGRKIELVIEEETSPKDTIERFQKLVQQDKVDCVQGIISTGVALALGPVVEEARALTIFWDGTTQDGVEEKLPNAKYLFKSTTTSARR
jgi:branched-chain amino acid transport system substrate-binding protein